MKFDYSKWKGPRPEDLLFMKQLMEIYRNLLLQAGGDADEALRWMEHFGEQYGFFSEQFGIADFKKMLEESGEAQRTPQGFKVTPKGEKRIRRDSLNEIFNSLQAGGAGDHRTPQAGKGGERLSETRAYQFGDDLGNLDPLGSVSNAVKRGGIDDLSLTVARGEIVALVGPSGCGKTTTLRLVAGFERPDAGEIHIAGPLVAAAARAFVPPERRHVGGVFQGFALFPLVAGTLYVNFGFWDVVEDRVRHEVGHFNRRVEREVLRLGGIKSLYSESYFTREEFDQAYGMPRYEALKARYDRAGRALHLYDKCVRGL